MNRRKFIQSAAVIPAVLVSAVQGTTCDATQYISTEILQRDTAGRATWKTVQAEIYNSWKLVHIPLPADYRDTTSTRKIVVAFRPRSIGILYVVDTDGKYIPQPLVSRYYSTYTEKLYADYIVRRKIDEIEASGVRTWMDKYWIANSNTFRGNNAAVSMLII